jgi:tetratricopeptide (TPR) repeat protein
MTQLHLLWQHFKANLQAIRGWIARTATFGKLAILTPLVGSGWLIMHELQNDVVTIEPIAVPKTLAEAGYTPEVAGYRLRDALNAYTQTSAAGDDDIKLNRSFAANDDSSLGSKLDLNISADKEPPDIVVPQLGLSVRAVGASIRNAFGMTRHAISGELTQQDNKYALRLRIDGRKVSSRDYEAENPDHLMTLAASDIMDRIRPAVLAMAQYRNEEKEAILKADEIIARYPKSNINVQWAYLLKGNYALRQKEYKTADQMFLNAVSSNRSSEEPHLQLGVSLLRQDRPVEAIKKFQDVLAINPKSAKALNNIGVALAAQANLGKGETDQAKLEEAIAEYRRAIKARPGYVLSYNNLGLALYYRNQLAEAVQQYQSAIDITPTYVIARGNLAYALRQRHINERVAEYRDEAITEYRAAIKFAVDPKQRAELHTFLGDFLRDYGEDGNLEPAIAEYKQAIAIHCYGWAHNNLGAIWRRQGKIRDGIDEFYQAAICDPKEDRFKTNFEKELREQQAGPVTVGVAENR